MNLHGVNLAAGCAVLLGIALVLFRAIRGPTSYDRVLATNVIGTKAVLLVALIGLISGRPEFLDISLLYAVINFVVTIAILKFVEYRRLG